MTDLTTRQIHDAITNGVSNEPGQDYWGSLDEGSPDWNDWIIEAQRNGVAAVIAALNCDHPKP